MVGRLSRLTITGSWKGGGYGDNRGAAGYPAMVTIAKRHGSLHGTAVHPGQCAGKRVYEDKKNGWFTFREAITRDRAADLRVPGRGEDGARSR